METYAEKQKRIYCENASTLTNNIITPKCVNGRKEFKVVVKYGADGVERDTVYLCDTCANAVKKDAEGHGYDVRITKLQLKDDE